jgi:hypothetical protein
MFLIWGRSTRIIKIYTDGYISCENCKSRMIDYFVHQTYFHLFWIPVFPLIKTVGNTCKNCEFVNNEVFSQTALDYEKQTKTPIYMYSWTIVITLIVVYVFLK